MRADGRARSHSVRTPFTLPLLLRETARIQPEDPAVEDKDRTASYGELDALSDALSRTLAKRGIGRGDRVGILMTKSIEAVVSLFGIMKTGAAYVPLDPNSPMPRVEYITRDCRMKAIVTDSAHLNTVVDSERELESVKLIVSTAAGRAGRSATEIIDWGTATGIVGEGGMDAAPIDRDLAYILYTSGSTGDPKGVMLSHRAALTFVNWAADAVALDSSDRLSQHAPLHFDLSVFDVFASVRAGATTVLVPQGLSVFPRSLADFISQRRITIWYSVPSVLTSLVTDGALDRNDYSSLRAVIFAGEVFPTKYLNALMTSLPGARYHNWYGPTETNVCTWHEVRTPPGPEGPPVPIGHACGNTEVFALGSDGEVVEVGGVGELHVRGSSLMEGYWGLPDRTAEVLVPDPRSQDHKDRVYRTGDVVRAGSDGSYQFLGRRDNMVKIRGYRIELGEVEAAIYHHDDVQSVAAVTVPEADGTGDLIKAVVVPAAGAGLDSRELGRHVAEHLPKYMVPAIFEFADELPTTSTGKVDRKKLVALHGTGMPTRVEKGGGDEDA